MTPLPDLIWDAAFCNDLQEMDRTHEEFVGLYNQLLHATESQYIVLLDTFIAHTEAHFAQENAWMQAIDFPHCHREEHERVLDVLRDVQTNLRQGHSEALTTLIKELPDWFDAHVNGMDAALAAYMRAVGFSPEASHTSPTIAAASAPCQHRTPNQCASMS